VFHLAGSISSYNMYSVVPVSFDNTLSLVWNDIPISNSISLNFSGTKG
jgi:hypothetical protein